MLALRGPGRRLPEHRRRQLPARTSTSAASSRFGVYKKLATFLVTVTAALVLRNYWALVVGQVAGRASRSH